jgi:glycosyltransferase involved in cell wall biosynthesis
MKIVQISTFHPDRCGIGDYTFDLCNALLKSDPGLHIDVLTYKSDRKQKVDNRENLRVHYVLPRRITSGHINKELQHIQPEIVHVQSSTFLHPLDLYRSLGSCRKRQLVATVHDAPKGLRLAYTFPSLRTLYDSASSIFVHSNLVAETLMKHHGVPIHKINTIPHGVDTRRYAPVSQDSGIRDKYSLGDSVLVVFFGFVRHGKGLEVLMKAWKLIETTDAALVIAGGTPSRSRRYYFLLRSDKEYYDHLRSFASQLELQNVHFLGFVPEDDVPKLLAEASVIVLPYEGSFAQSGPLHKSMAAGTAILATDVSGFNNIIVNGINGMLVPPGSVEELAFGLETLLSDPPLREELGRAARSTAVTCLDWSSVAAQTIAVYRSLLTA